MKNQEIIQIMLLLSYYVYENKVIKICKNETFKKRILNY